MSEDKKSNTDKVESPLEMTRKIWLAGIGAYGRALNEAQEHIERASRDTTEFFEELVENGSSFEQETLSKLSNPEILEEVKNRADQFRAEAEKIRTAGLETIDDRMAKVRESFGIQNDQSDLQDQISLLIKKVDALTADVASIKASLEKPSPRRKSAAKKKTATKKTKK